MKRIRLRNKTWTDYINRRKANPDGFWEDQEKWLYYRYEHQNWILPIIICCVILFFTNPPGINITYIAICIGWVLLLCHLDNIASLDNNPQIVKRRNNIIEHRIRNNRY